MSTNAMIGWYADKKGRWIHWDGYPSNTGVELVKIIKRDTPTIAMNKLINERYGWSYLNANFQDYDHEEDQYFANDPRFAPEIDYGVAYTTEQGQSTPDTWFYLNDNTTEWQYLITETGNINVYDHNELIGQINPTDPQAENQMMALEEKENQGINLTNLTIPQIIETLQQTIEELTPETLNDYLNETENFTEEFISLAQDNYEWEHENATYYNNQDNNEPPQQYNKWELTDAEKYLNTPGWGYTHDAENLIKNFINTIRSITHIKLIYN